MSVESPFRVQPWREGGLAVVHRPFDEDVLEPESCRDLECRLPYGEAEVVFGIDGKVVHERIGGIWISAPTV